MGATAAEAKGRSEDTEALYREHGAAVVAFCRSLLRDRAEAEDAAQQVFLSAHRALLNGAAPREPLAWLLAVARHECYARFRQHAAAPVAAAEAPDRTVADASTQVLRAGELATVWDEVGRMPPAQREAFLLREIRGLSYGQLADELSLSRPSVRSLLLRARTRLRRRLGDVAAGVGSAPWVQALFRIGGDGASPVPAATKAAAVGVGALALVGGGGLVARHASWAPSHAGARHQAARARRVADPAPGAIAPREDRPGSDHHRGTRLERSPVRNDGSGESGSRRSGSRDGSAEIATSSGDTSSGSGRDGSGSDTTAPAVQPTSSGSDGGGSSSSGPGSGSTDGSTSSVGRDSGTSGSGSGSGSDGGSSTTTATTTTTTSSGSDGSGGGHGG